MRDNIKKVKKLINEIEENKSNREIVETDITFLEYFKNGFGFLSGLSIATPILYAAGMSAIQHFSGVEQDYEKFGLVILSSYAGYFGFDWLKTKTSNKLQGLKNELKQLKSDRTQIIGAFREMATLADRAQEFQSSSIKSFDNTEDNNQKTFEEDVLISGPFIDENTGKEISYEEYSEENSNELSVKKYDKESDKVLNKINENNSLQSSSGDAVLEAVVFEE